jgi:hypothetical protein
VRHPFRSLGIGAALAAGALGLGAPGPVAAQTTTSTTVPPVRSIPVTPAAPAPTTTSSAGGSAAAPLAATGIAADRLVPFGFVLIGMGAALVGAARRYGRPAYRFL